MCIKVFLIRSAILKNSVDNELTNPLPFFWNEDNEGQGDYENEDTTILGMSQEINLSEVKNNENVDEDGTDDESNCADLKLRC